MRRRALVIGAPFVLIALLGSACRAIVGITDLAVDGGAASDATQERAHSDSGEASSDARDTGAPPEAHADASDAHSDAPSDTGSDRADATDARGVNCDAQDPSEASIGRQMCLVGCLGGHFAAASAFYGAAMACICKNCSDVCEAYCAPSCAVTTMGACNDCATHMIVDDGGVCQSFEDRTCAAGCDKLAICLPSCPAS